MATLYKLLRIVGLGISCSLVGGQIEYQPGNLANYELNMYLSMGMNARIIGRAGQPVKYYNGTLSTEVMHGFPDGAATFVDERPHNVGGWVYVSNSEIHGNQGGVGAFTFDKDGNIIEYKRLLTGSNRNCNGGKTQWNTWISCEENVNTGIAWQVDPFGEREPVPITLGSTGGNWESFAHDTRDETKLYAFITEDTLDGAVQRMTISNPKSFTDPWDILLSTGPVDYLVLEEFNSCDNGTEAGTFTWIDDEAQARANAALNYPFCEGMEVDGNLLRLVSKTRYGIFTLNLDLGTYIFEETSFEGQPDQLFTVEREDGVEITFLTEEAPPVSGVLGEQVGLYTRTVLGGLTTNIVFGDDQSSETTGIALSPNGKHLYFAYQADGVLYELTRSDGLSFLGPSVPLSECLSWWNQLRNTANKAWIKMQFWFLYGYSKVAGDYEE